MMWSPLLNVWCSSATDSIDSMVEIKTDLCSRVPCSSTVRNKNQSEGWDVLEKPNPLRAARFVKHLVVKKDF